jgi:hypothetical protein
MLGITEVAITRGSSSFPNPKSKRPLNFPVDISSASGSIGFRFRFYRYGNWHPSEEIRNALFRERKLESPSLESLSFGDLYGPIENIKKFSREEMKELRGIKGIVPLRSDVALRLMNNRIFFDAAIRALLRLLDPHYPLVSYGSEASYDKYQVIDEDVCRTILKTVRQERKARSQMNAFLSIEM